MLTTNSATPDQSRLSTAVATGSLPTNEPTPIITGLAITGDYLTIDQLAAALNTSVRTLKRWHALRKGPAQVRIGHTVLYRTSAVNEWLKSKETAPVSHQRRTR